jgi:hypothetical protein
MPKVQRHANIYVENNIGITRACIVYEISQKTYDPSDHSHVVNAKVK